MRKPINKEDAGGYSLLMLTIVVIVWIILVSIFCSGCVSSKPGGEQSGPKKPNKISAYYTK